MNRGILLIAFGYEYDHLAAHTVRYSRRFTDLPIHVLTNIKDRNKLWDEIKYVTFTQFDLHQSRNRAVKTRMADYTPFEETLYLDCDSVIQKPGIEDVFDLLGNKDMALNLFIYWHKTNKVLKIYKRAMKATGTVLPLSIYNGGFICFKKNDEVIDFFRVWHKFWIMTGRGREMPALACAVNQSCLKVAEVNTSYHGFFEPDVYNPNCIVQHNYNSNQGKHFFEEFDLPKIKQFKPFDRDGSQSDWSWEDFNE